MESAEALYRTDTSDGKSPPFWLDVSFVLILSMIHIIYSIKFSKFSLTYLKAKCAEKLSKKQWNESKLYLHAILSQKIENYVDLQTNDGETDKLVYTDLWDRIIILRYILRIIIFLCCWVVLTVYITGQLNLGFEYFVLCLLKPQNGSFLGLFMLPFFFFVHIAVIRYIIYGIIVSWTVNVDSVADRISYQQHQREIKHFAQSSTSIINTTQTRTFKDKIAAFNSPYFMAVHWRILVVSLSILASIIGFPFLSNENELEVQDVFFIRLFIRYIFIAMSCWLAIYCIISVTASLCARVSTLFMFDAALNSDDKQTQSIKRKNSFLRLFCLVDAFGIKDENIIWKKYKIITYSVYFGGGMLLIIIGLGIGNGLIWFIGFIDILYYAVNVLLTTKPRGIYYLWTADMSSLELDHDETVDPLPDVRHIVLQQNMSKHSEVIASGFKSHLAQVSKNIIKDIDSEQDEAVANLETIWQEEMEEIKNMDETPTPSLNPSLNSSLNPSLAENTLPAFEMVDERQKGNEIQKNVLKLFLNIYETTYNDRRVLVKQKESRMKVFFNYFDLTFKLYTQYWLLILPYNYKIRPLSLFCSGQSVTENIIKYEYKKKTCLEMMKEILIQIWHILKGPTCAILVFLSIIFGLYISAKIHFQLNKDSNQILHETYAYNNSNATDLYSLQQYPICDSLHWNGNLSTLDLSVLSSMIYKVHDVIDARELTCLYFDSIFPQDTMNQNKSRCSWKVIYVSSKLPLFMHLRHDENKTDLIVVRGTSQFLEYMQDFALFNQVVFLQVSSWIVPVTTILPTEFIIQIVHFSSLIEGVVDDIVRARYDIPVYQYAFKLLKNANYEIHSLYFAGHSMGGSIGMAVAAQLYGIHKQENTKYFDSHKNLEFKSFAVNSPGILYNSRKFSLNAYDVYSTATVVKNRYDILSEIDVTIGFVQNVQCNEENTYLLNCHRTSAIIYELATKCDVYHSNNPTIIKAMKYFIENGGGDMGGEFDYGDALNNTYTQ